MSSSTKTKAKAGSPLSVVEAHMAAEDRQDVNAAVDCFTDDCYYEVPGIGVRLDGKAEIRDWYEKLFAAVPDFRNVNERYWMAEADGKTSVFFESDFEGTHRGTWHGWSPTNRRFCSSMLVRIPIAADGLMEAEIVYEDSADIFMQLGILPKRESRQERLLQAVHRARTSIPGLR